MKYIEGMRTPVLPFRYFLLLFLILAALSGLMILAEFLATSNIASFEIIIETPFTNPLTQAIFDTLLIAIITLVLYTIGVYFIVRKIPDEVSRLTAVKIFSAILLSMGVVLVLMAWLRDPEKTRASSRHPRRPVTPSSFASPPSTL